MSDTRDKPGPLVTVITRYNCVGCPSLRLKDWEFYGENDEIDRGTDADCMSMGGKNISTYWYTSTSAPEWCPFLKND